MSTKNSNKAGKEGRRQQRRRNISKDRTRTEKQTRQTGWEMQFVRTPCHMAALSLTRTLKLRLLSDTGLVNFRTSTRGGYLCV